MKDYNSLLKYLEEEVAPNLLDEKMEPFPRQGKDSIFACPWLNWRRSDASTDKIRGIFIMQDWWCSSSNPEPLEKNVAYISEKLFLKVNNPTLKVNDPTIGKLYNFDAWKKAIWDDKSWLVTNAVWGLRMGEISSGDLGAKIHKAAFPIWSQIIKHFADRDDFKVVFAGAWSASRNERKVWEGKALSDFLESWKVWAGKGIGKNDEVSKLDFTDVNGNAYFCCHPSVRKIKFNCLEGPP